MTTKDAFTEEEWARLERSPIVAAMAITLADPGGPIEAVKESMAGIKTVQEAAQSDRPAGADPRGRHEPHREDAGPPEPAEGLQAEGRARRPGDPGRAQGGATAVAQKGTPEEAAAFREWLLTSAKRAADAAKEGGFMGFKAERVSEGEQAMLDQLREALAA